MSTWYRYYALLIAVHVLEVVIVGLAAAIIKSIKPAYETRDLLVIIAVGMIAGIIYFFCMNRLTKH